MVPVLKILALPILGISLLVLVLFLERPQSVKSELPNLVITTVGLDDLHIGLKAPYGTASIHHALIVNDSPHTLLACEIIFEFITRDGEIRSNRKVVGYTELLLAKPAARQALIKFQPAIAPHSKMLVGLGVEPDLVRISGTLPPLTTKTSIEETGANLEMYEKLVIRLNAVVIEDGHAFGPGAADFLTHLKALLGEKKP
jgi:hypothetical protein